MPTKCFCTLLTGDRQWPWRASELASSSPSLHPSSEANRNRCSCSWTRETGAERTPQHLGLSQVHRASEGDPCGDSAGCYYTECIETVPQAEVTAPEIAVEYPKSKLKELPHPQSQHLCGRTLSPQDKDHHVELISVGGSSPSHGRSYQSGLTGSARGHPTAIPCHVNRSWGLGKQT